MDWIDPRLLAHQEKRFTRPDGDRFIRPDWRRFIRHDSERFFLPGCCPEESKQPYPKSYAQRRCGEEEESRTAEDELATIAGERDRIEQEIEQERLKIKSEMAWLRLKRAWIQLRPQQKAYDPEQPRVPKHNPGGGQWTRDGGTGRIRLAGDIPANDPPEPPNERPPTAKIRNRIARKVATAALLTGRGIPQIIGAAEWLNEEYPRIASFLDPPRSLEELREGVAAPKYGYDIHHIVEKSSALEDGFSQGASRQRR